MQNYPVCKELRAQFFSLLKDEQQNADIRKKLQELYGSASGVVFHQVVAKLQDSYHGNMETFQTEFFYPAINLLVKLKKVSVS